MNADEKDEKDLKIQELEKTVLALRIEIRDLKNQLYQRTRHINKMIRDEHEYNVDNGSNYDR